MSVLPNRRDVVARLVADRGDLLVVTGLGQPCWDCFAAGDDPRNFYLWGAMGGAIPLGLGLAIARPDRRVLVITGDGEALMGLGALATVATAGAANLAVAVLDNEAYGETGGQATHTASGTDLAGVALSVGFREAVTARNGNEVAEAVRVARAALGPVLAVVKVANEPLPLVLPPKDGQLLKLRFREAVLGVRE